MATRVAINGLGRIGRAFVRQVWDRDDIEIVAVNDLGTLESLAYLLTYDTVYGKAPFSVEVGDSAIIVAGKKVRFLSERDPLALPWGELAVDVVVEATGVFTNYEKANAHIEAGAKRVVITGPVSEEHPLGATVLMGLDDSKLKTCPITSNASCTTNSASPVIAVLDETIGIERAVLSTVHAYTATQAIVDGPSKKDLREGRAAAQNIIPSSTGAAIAVTKAYPTLTGKFDGISLRVPVVAGSIADITFVAKRSTTKEEVNDILKEYATKTQWQGLLEVSEEPIVSSDIIGMRAAAIVDLEMTRVVDGTLVKVLAWYDNEAGYAATLVQHVLKASAA